MGTMEVALMSAKDLKNGDFIGGTEPYVLIQYKSQEHKSSIAKAPISRIRCCMCLKGQRNTNPVWNEKFKFRVDFPAEDDKYTLVLKIMDHDKFSADDYLGQATIHVKELLEIGVEKGKAELRPQKYRVVSTNKTYHGEIQVGVKFSTKEEADQKENNGDKKNNK